MCDSPVATVDAVATSQCGKVSPSMVWSWASTTDSSSTTRNLNMRHLLVLSLKSWKGEGEVRPLAHRAIFPDDTGVGVNDPVDHRQPQPRAGPAPWPASKEEIENPVLELLRHTWAIVAVIKFDPLATLAIVDSEGHSYMEVLVFRNLAGVLDQLEQRVLQQVAVAIDFEYFAIALERPSARRERLQGSGDPCDEVDPLEQRVHTGEPLLDPADDPHQFLEGIAEVRVDFAQSREVRLALAVALE